MHCHAPATGHESRYLVGRRRFAAARQHREQLVHADNQDALRCRREVRGVPAGQTTFPAESPHPILPPAGRFSRRDVTAAERGEKLVDVAQLKPRRQHFEILPGPAEPLQILLQNGTPMRHGCIELLDVEPLPYFCAGAIALLM